MRAEGLEPPRPRPPEPKSGVSTNSTTPAGAAPEYPGPTGTGMRQLLGLQAMKSRGTALKPSALASRDKSRANIYLPSPPKINPGLGLHARKSCHSGNLMNRRHGCLWELGCQTKPHPQCTASYLGITEDYSPKWLTACVNSSGSLQKSEPDRLRWKQYCFRRRRESVSQAKNEGRPRSSDMIQSTSDLLESPIG